MTMQDTEQDLDIITALDFDEALPCEVFIHDAIGSTADAKYIVRVTPNCSGGCAISDIGTVTVLFCQPCLDAAGALRWTLEHQGCGTITYTAHSVDPIKAEG